MAKCAKCGGKLNLDEHGVLVCDACGARFKPKKKTPPAEKAPQEPAADEKKKEAAPDTAPENEEDMSWTMDIPDEVPAPPEESREVPDAAPDAETEEEDGGKETNDKTDIREEEPAKPRKEPGTASSRKRNALIKDAAIVLALTAVVISCFKIGKNFFSKRGGVQKGPAAVAISSNVPAGQELDSVSLRDAEGAVFEAPVNTKIQHVVTVPIVYYKNIRDIKEGTLITEDMLELRDYVQVVENGEEIDLSDKYFHTSEVAGRVVTVAPLFDDVSSADFYDPSKDQLQPPQQPPQPQETTEETTEETAEETTVEETEEKTEEKSADESADKAEPSEVSEE